MTPYFDDFREELATFLWEYGRIWEDIGADGICVQAHYTGLRMGPNLIFMCDRPCPLVNPGTKFQMPICMGTCVN
jgi:hypothetical protein